MKVTSGVLLTFGWVSWVAEAAVKTRASAFASQTSDTRVDARVLLSDVKVLTLYQSRQTTGRRAVPVPQLQCQGGCDQWTPDLVQCYNMGQDGFDAAWKCEASMPNGYTFSSIEVGCEGYNHLDDPYILAGSCQLIYSLKAPRRSWRSHLDGDTGWGEQAPGNDGRNNFMTWAVLGVVGFMAYNAWQQYMNAPPGPPPPPGGGHFGGGGGGGSGGGGGGNNWRGGNAPSDPSDPPSKPSSGTTESAPPQDNQAAGGGGLFPWLAGAGIGAALGYLVRPPRQQRGYMRSQAPGAWAYRDAGEGGVRRRGTGSRDLGGGRGGGGVGLQAGYGGTSRR